MSVLAAMKSTPSRRDSIIVLIALPPPPPTPITLILARLSCSSSNSRSAIDHLPTRLVVAPFSVAEGRGQIFCRDFFSPETRQGDRVHASCERVQCEAYGEG